MSESSEAPLRFGKFRDIDKIVRLRHPGYDDSCNLLFTLYGLDHPDGGVHLETARTVCGVLAGNRWDGILTRSAFYNEADACSGPLFIGKDAYFHLPEWQPVRPDDSDAQLKRRYPIYVRWDEWSFPHRNLPPIWNDVLPHPERTEPLRRPKKSTVKPSEGDQVGNMRDTVTSLQALTSICDPMGSGMASVAEEHSDEMRVIEDVSEPTVASGGETPLTTQTDVDLSHEEGETAVSETSSSDDKTTAASLQSGHDDRGPQLPLYSPIDSPIEPEIPDTGFDGAPTERAAERIGELQNFVAGLKETVENMSADVGKLETDEYDGADWCQLCDYYDYDTVSSLEFYGPQPRLPWLKKNRFWKYTIKEPKLEDEYEDTEILRKDLQGDWACVWIDNNCQGERHNSEMIYAWIRGQWAFVPKFEWCGQPRLVAHMFVPQYGKWLDEAYWDKGMFRDRPIIA